MMDIILKFILMMTALTRVVIGGQFGSRLYIEKSLAKAIANSEIDGRIAAILNSGSTIGDYYSSSNTRTKSDRMGQTSSITHMNTIASDLPQEYGGDNPLIEVSGSETPVGIIFRTKSPKVKVEQRHNPGMPTEVEATRHEEEPHTVRHEIFRPVIQELKEVIQPYRRYIQEIQPVIEEIHQIVSSSQNSRPNKYTEPDFPSSRPQTTTSAATKPSKPQLSLYQNMATSFRKPIPMSPQRYYSSALKSPQKLMSSSRSWGMMSSYSQPLRPTYDYNIQHKTREMPEKDVQTYHDRKGMLISDGLSYSGALSGMSGESGLSVGHIMNAEQYNDFNIGARPNSAGDDYFIDYKIPVDFDLADNKALPITSINSNSKVYELSLNRPELDLNGNRNQYSSTSKISSNNVNQINGAYDTKSTVKSAVKSK